MKALLLSLVVLAMGIRQPVPVTTPEPEPPELTPREKILKVASGEVGVKEKTGRNDGEVDKYNAAVGLGGTGAPYCASFVYWVGKEALGSDNPYPKTAWSPSMVSRGTRVKENTQPRGAETFGIYFKRKKRIAHTGIVEERKGSYFITIEGNTSSNAAVGSAADREGHGVYRKRRHWRTVHSTRDWLK